MKREKRDTKDILEKAFFVVENRSHANDLLRDQKGF
jgi:hypothetical protein